MIWKELNEMIWKELWKEFYTMDKDHYLVLASSYNNSIERFETTYNNQYFKFEVVGDKVGSICT